MKILKVLCAVTADAFFGFAYFVKSNLVNFANILNFTSPYVMYAVGRYITHKRGNESIGGEIFIPILFAVVTYYLKSTANKLGKGITVPVPEKRFTQVDDDGEVSIENNKIQEIILYLADLEDWLEKKGLL